MAYGTLPSATGDAQAASGEGEERRRITRIALATVVVCGIVGGIALTSNGPSAPHVNATPNLSTLHSRSANLATTPPDATLAIVKSEATDAVAATTDDDADDSSDDATTTSGQAPNVLLYTIDDMGWNDIGYSKDNDFPDATPHMNALASKGVKLTRYYTQPSCTPSRSTIMSGKWVHKTGYQNIEIQHNWAIGMPLSMKLMPEHMRDLGYKTVGYGKWNIGHCSKKYLPHERGFDYYFGYTCPGHGYRDYTCGMGADVRDMFEAGHVSSTETAKGSDEYFWETGDKYLGKYDTEIYTSKAITFLKRHLGEADEAVQPFFMWMAHHGAHGFLDSNPEPPRDILDPAHLEYLDVLRERSNNHTFFKKRLITAAIMMSLDASINRVVNVLETYNAMDNTVLVVHSDNGGDPDYNFGHPGNNYPLRGDKFFYLEGGVRVPAFVYAPGILPERLKGTEYHGMVHHVDLLTTFVSLAGGDAKAEDAHLDGHDFITGIIQGKEVRKEIVFALPRSGSDWTYKHHEEEEVAALRMGDYKLLITSVYDQRYDPTSLSQGFLTSICTYGWYGISAGKHTPKCQWGAYLYNLEKDPLETVNLFDDDNHKAIKQTMMDRVHTLLDENPYNYGKLMREYYAKGVKNSKSYEQAVEARNYWLGPWDCDVIP